MCCMWERVMVSCSWGLNGTRCRAVHVKAAVLCAACGDKQHVEVERGEGRLGCMVGAVLCLQRLSGACWGQYGWQCLDWLAGVHDVREGGCGCDGVSTHTR